MRYYYRLFYWFAVFIISLLVVACSTSETPVDSIGELPLATWDPSGSTTFLDATVGNGVLDISNNCVRLILENDLVVLLVWPEPTSWNVENRVIEFVGPQGEQMELREGDEIMPGGMSLMGDIEYVSSPDPACQADETFIVSSVKLMSDS